MKTFITADWHLGEDRFAIMQRPFVDAQQMVDKLVENHNSLVNQDDLVYVNGDVLYQKADPSIYLNQISRFNGRKILIRGNHDRVFSDEQFKPYFEEIIAEGNGVEVTIGEIQCYINHYPSLAIENRFNLVGHIHSAWKFQLNSLNVGVDVHHHFPVNFDQIPFFFKAICEFYDDDVWSAYLPANANFTKTRGKKGNYFTGEKK